MEFKELVLVKAKEIFIKYGYNKTTMRDIAKACHKSKGLIYHHYKSKEEILQIIAEQEIKELTSTLSVTGSPFEMIKGMIIQVSRLINNKSGLYNKIVQDLDEYIPFLEEKINGLLGHLTVLIESILQEGVDTGEFEIDSISETAACVISLIFNTALQSISKVKALMNSNVELTAEIITRGLLKKK